MADVPQTNALAHLIAMFTGQTGAQGAAPGPVDQLGVQGGAAVGSSSQIPPGGAQGASPLAGLMGGGQYNGALPGMPVASPQAWMKQGAGNFMPGGQSMGAGGGQGKGGMGQMLQSMGGGSSASGGSKGGGAAAGGG